MGKVLPLRPKAEPERAPPEAPLAYVSPPANAKAAWDSLKTSLAQVNGALSGSFTTAGRLHEAQAHLARIETEAAKIRGML